MKLNAIRPIGPHVTGVIRFASEGQGTEEFRQLDHFEVLGRSYELPNEPGEIPRLKPHSINAQLHKEQGAEHKLRSIPIKLIFDKPENSLSARYEAFDPQLNRMVCVGDGEKCARADTTKGTVEEASCNGPDACEFANNGQNPCSLRVRLAVQIDGQDDPLSVFEVQSSGIHTYRNFAAKLEMLHALAGKRLRGIPLELQMYERGSPAFEFKTFYVADLKLRGTLDDALKAAAPEGAGHGAMEVAVEAMRKDTPFALGGDVDFGVVPFRMAPSSRREPRSPSTGQPAKTLEAVVASARELAGTSTPHVLASSATAQGITIAGPAAGPSTSEGDAEAAPQNFGEKMPSVGPRSLPF